MFFRLIFRYVALFFITLAFIACNHTDTSIEGDLDNNIAKRIYLSKITPDGTILIDSTEIRQGHFRFNIKTEENVEPVIYQLSLSSVNSMNTIAKSGDRLQIAADANNLAKSYTIQGGNDAELMLQLDRMLTAFIDTVDLLYAIYEQNLEDDEIRAEIDLRYNQLLTRYSSDLIRFIQQNSQSMVAIPAFYQMYNRRQFLQEEENLPLLRLIYNDLKKKYPDNENVIFLKKRIELIESNTN